MCYFPPRGEGCPDLNLWWVYCLTWTSSRNGRLGVGKRVLFYVKLFTNSMAPSKMYKSFLLKKKLKRCLKCLNREAFLHTFFLEIWEIFAYHRRHKYFISCQMKNEYWLFWYLSPAKVFFDLYGILWLACSFLGYWRQEILNVFKPLRTCPKREEMSTSVLGYSLIN